MILSYFCKKYKNVEIYNKQPLTYEQQISLLKSRGLFINDEDRIKRHLKNISYYRLSAYMLPYKQMQNGLITENFTYGTTWDDVYDLYVFDRKFRLLIFDAIERLEIAIRTQIIYQLSHKYSSHWQDDASIFKPAQQRRLQDGRTAKVDVFAQIQNHIQEQLHNNKAEAFIKHYKNKYTLPQNPPSWMSLEIMYFNHLSCICSSLKNRTDINGISQYFDLPPKTFCSWLHTINYVRNLCAHHARLWNRDFNIVPEKLHYSKHLIWISDPEKVQRSKIYFFLCMVNFMLQTANPTSNFTQRLYDLLSEYEGVVNYKSMGFSPHWEEEKLWQK